MATRILALLPCWLRHSWVTDSEKKIDFQLFRLDQHCARCGKKREQIVDAWDQVSGI